MKLKDLFKVLALTFVISVTIDSCSPTSNPPDTPTLNHIKTGNIMSTKDSNSYNFGLSCGCAFELKAEGADTSKIHYDFGNSATSYTTHVIKAFPKLPLASGTYTGWIAVVTLKPDTNPDLRDTLRDTVKVP